ncbi:MAG TPA: ester cyclase [Candidatus Tectomicrobia bacterium]|nr:ester cyclase [Candidatus Tectomicrobia bacterium]
MRTRSFWDAGLFRRNGTAASEKAPAHRGPLMGIEPTNKQVRWSGIAIDRVVGGKIARLA